MKNDSYSMSFTTGALFHLETIRLASLFQELENWSIVRDRVLAENILQASTSNTAKRVCSEIISRLKKLSFRELKFLLQTDHHEQGYILWLAVCRRYPFIGEFSRELLRERFLTLQHDLSPQEFDAFFNKKAEWHPALDRIQPSTRKKLRQVLFKMLREAGLLAEDNSIIAAIFSPALMQVITSENPEDITCFPTLEPTAKEAPK